MKTFDDIKEAGHRVTSYVSWCGGLPAPEGIIYYSLIFIIIHTLVIIFLNIKQKVSNNPLGYKFSWSPRGVLLAALNKARYKKGDTIVEVDDILKSAVDVPLYKGFALEGTPNRDSLKYETLYEMTFETLFRGTLRYKGYSALMNSFKSIGLISLFVNKDMKIGVFWPQLLMNLVGANDFGHIESCIIKIVGDKESGTEAYNALKWLDMLDSESLVKVPASGMVLDAFCSVLEDKLRYNPNESDMVCMHNIFEYETEGLQKVSHDIETILNLSNRRN